MKKSSSAEVQETDRSKTTDSEGAGSIPEADSGGASNAASRAQADKEAAPAPVVPALSLTSSSSSTTTSEAPASRKKTPKHLDKRRCIGRKPVTDFSVGAAVSGKVVYAKPKLGAFIDIKCHSDAFLPLGKQRQRRVSSDSMLLTPLHHFFHVASINVCCPLYCSTCL